jgi:hypothetical protein
MIPEYKSKIETDSQTGRKSLVVYYDFQKDNFDEAIDAAMAEHGIRAGQMNIIAIPEELKRDFG